MRRAVIILLVTWFAAMAQQAITGSLPDIAGTGATVALSSTPLYVRTLQLVAPIGNSSVVRWGGPLTTSSRGSAIAAGGGQYFPPLPINQGASSQTQRNLANIYVYIANGDTLTVSYEQ